MNKPACLIVATLFISFSLAANAQQAVETIDPALLNSEPVEDIPPEVPKPLPVKPNAKKEVPAPLPDKIIEEMVKTDFPIAHLQGLNKVTAKTTTIEAPIGVSVYFGTLQITLKKCWKALPEDKPENAALLEIVDNKVGGHPAPAFSGWMFSSSPAISALEHPVYDITLLECADKK